VLDDFDGGSLRVFVVWEPVIGTDVAPPTSATLARLHDRRAAQYWDEGRDLSEEIVRAVRADPKRYGFDEAPGEDAIVWDVVALFPRGALWEKDVPIPTYYGGPVVDSVASLRKALGEREAGSSSVH
jgi:hypothetical protein